MNILICKDGKGGTAILTTDSPGSHYGIPVLRIEAEDVDGDFGPADVVVKKPPFITAADVVCGWAYDRDRTHDEVEAARRFCAQWPDGPQVPDETKEGNGQ